MLLIAHETENDVRDSANALSSLGNRSVNLMIDVVTEQGVSKNTISKTILDLENQGFVRIKDASTLWQKSFYITPTLLGEEALDYYLDNIKKDC